jgi:hypothetical protein
VADARRLIDDAARISPGTVLGRLVEHLRDEWRGNSTPLNDSGISLSEFYLPENSIGIATLNDDLET